MATHPLFVTCFIEQFAHIGIQELTNKLFIASSIVLFPGDPSEGLGEKRVWQPGGDHHSRCPKLVKSIALPDERSMHQRHPSEFTILEAEEL